MSDTQQVGIQETLLVEPSSALLLSSPTLAELRCIAENRPACQLFECGADKFEVEISPQIEGQTLILWDASQVVPSDAGALTAQIEFSRYDVSASSAWSIVRAHALNIGIWQDPLQRVFGKNSNAYYRIAIRDVAGTVYRSLPTRAGDYIPKLMKPIYNEIIRRWQNRGKRGELRRGYILKKIRYGPRCTICRDRDSGNLLQSQCAICFGTGWQLGYYRASYCVYAELAALQVTEQLSLEQNFAGGSTTQIKLLNYPRLYPGDVWVEEATDHRWELGDILHGQAVGSVDVITTCAASRLDFTNVAYQFQTTGQY